MTPVKKTKEKAEAEEQSENKDTEEEKKEGGRTINTIRSDVYT